MRRGMDHRQLQQFHTAPEYKMPYELNESSSWREEMRVVRKLNKLAKAASSYQTPKK